MAWLTNGRVAWEVPRGRVARFFLEGAYLLPEGWVITRKLDEPPPWTKGPVGEMRREPAGGQQ